MGGRQFNARNKEAPACVEAISAKVPQCFEPKVWRLFVEDCYRSAMNDEAERARMNRGEAPDYCSCCTRGYQARMKAAGRCHPPQKTAQLSLVPEDAEASDA